MPTPAPRLKIQNKEWTRGINVSRLHSEHAAITESEQVPTWAHHLFGRMPWYVLTVITSLAAVLVLINHEILPTWALVLIGTVPVVSGTALYVVRRSLTKKHLSLRRHMAALKSTHAEVHLSGEVILMGETIGFLNNRPVWGWVIVAGETTNEMLKRSGKEIWSYGTGTGVWETNWGIRESDGKLAYETFQQWQREGTRLVVETTLSKNTISAYSTSWFTEKIVFRAPFVLPGQGPREIIIDSAKTGIGRQARVVF